MYAEGAECCFKLLFLLCYKSESYILLREMYGALQSAQQYCQVNIQHSAHNLAMSARNIME